MKLLIAEDSLSLQFIYKELMRGWKFEFDLVENGQKALESVLERRERYDLCLMDMEMPVMGGLEAIGKMRQKAPYFPILALSSDEYYEAESLRAGADAFVRKPCREEALYKKIREHTVKYLALYLDRNGIALKQEMPAGPEELKELMAIDKTGRTRLVLVDSTQSFLVHKTLRERLNGAMLSGGTLLPEFLDRTPGDPGVVRFSVPGISVDKRSLPQSHFEQAVEIEDRELGELNR